MINNDWHRSSEFFTAPVKAAAAARAMPFSLPMILGLHLLLAIANALIEYYVQPNFDFTSQMATVNADQAAALQEVQTALDALYASPFLLTAASFAIGLLTTTFFWQIGRAMSGTKITFEEAQSAMLRFLLLKRGITVAIVLVILFVPIGFLGMFGLIFMAYLNVLYLFVIQGAMELKSGWVAIWVVLLSYLAILGLGSVLMFIVMAVF